MAWSQADTNKLWPWLLPLTGPPGHITQRFKGGFPGSGENGVDLGMPPFQPVTSLTAGQVLTNGYYAGGGVVTVESTLPLGIGVASVFYQHLDLNNPALTPGTHVKVGDLIGLSGGQLSGGHHPSSRQFSNGPHIEVGINAPFSKNGLWHPLGPNIDPLPWMQYLAANGPSGTDIVSGAPPPLGTVPTTVQALTRGTGPIPDAWADIEARLDSAMLLQSPGDASSDVSGWNALLPWNWAKMGADAGKIMMADAEAILLRGIIILIGVAILLAFVFNVMANAAEQAAPAIEGGAAVAAAAA